MASAFNVTGFGVLLNEAPTRVLWYLKDVSGEILVAILWIGVLVSGKLIVQLVERVGDVFQEDEPQHDVLVLTSTDVPISYLTRSIKCSPVVGQRKASMLLKELGRADLFSLSLYCLRLVSV